MSYRWQVLTLPCHDFWSQREEFVQSTEVLVAALTKIPSINDKDAESVRLKRLLVITFAFVCDIPIVLAG